MQAARDKAFSQRLAIKDEYRDEMAATFKGFDWIAKNKHEHLL